MQIITTHPSHHRHPHHHHHRHHRHHRCNHHHHHHPTAVIMGTGKGSRSGPGSSSSSGSGSPPPPPPPPHRAETQGGDDREADEEEPAEKNSSQPSSSGSASTTATESSVCSHTVATSPPRTGRRPQPELVSSPWFDSSVTAAGSAWSGHQSLQTRSPVSRRPSLSSEDGESSLDAGTSARKRRSVKSSRPEGGGGCLPESAHPGGHHTPQCESHGGHPSGSSSSLEQGASRETPSRGDPPDTGDPQTTHPSQLSGVPLGGPPESSGGLEDPAPQPSDSPGSRLLEHHNLVQEEKLVAATLASLDQCGNPSNIIKQDLRLIIQSRRKAEGKEELSVDFKSPPKEELSEEEWQRALKRRHQNRRAAQRFRHKQRQISSSLADPQLSKEELEKRARRRELNRQAAKRSRDKCQRRRDLLLKEINRLETTNGALEGDRHSLTRERESLVRILKGHLRRCQNSLAISRTAQIIAFSQRLAQLLEWSGPTRPAPDLASPSAEILSPRPVKSALLLHAPTRPQAADLEGPEPSRGVSDTALPSTVSGQGGTGEVQGPPPAHSSLLLHSPPRPHTADLQSVSTVEASQLMPKDLSSNSVQSAGLSRPPVLELSASSTSSGQRHQHHQQQQQQQKQQQGKGVHGRTAVFAGKNLEIDTAAAAALREDIQRFHRRLQRRLSAPPSPTGSALGPVPPVRHRQSSVSPLSSSPPHAASQPATPTFHIPTSAPHPLSGLSVYPAHTLVPEPLLSSRVRSQPVSPHCSSFGVPQFLHMGSEGDLNRSSSSASPSDRAKAKEPLSVPVSSALGGAQRLTSARPLHHLDVRGGGITPKKDPASHSPVLPKKNPFLRLQITPQNEPSLPSTTVPKQEPVLRSPPILLPKKDPALRPAPVLPKKNPSLRSPTIPKKDPALRSLAEDPSTPSSPPPDPSPASAGSGVPKRGSVLRVASFHGLSSADEQLAPLNLSKRRKSEDLEFLVVGRDVQQQGQQQHNVLLSRGTAPTGLTTWPPPRSLSWLRAQEERRTERNVLLEAAPPALRLPLSWLRAQEERRMERNVLLEAAPPALRLATPRRTSATVTSAEIRMDPRGDRLPAVCPEDSDDVCC